MVRQLCEIGDFVRRMRAQFRFGDLSRAPLQLLRFEVQGDSAECEWIARRPDPWDVDLPPSVRDRNVAQQALRDALRVRDLLFSILPDVSTVDFRVYRHCAPPDLIIVGKVERVQAILRGIRSLTMQAKLRGLQFRLEDGRLEPLQPK